MHGTSGMKLLSRFRLNFTRLNYCKFSHGFRDMTDAMCECGKELTLHCFLRWNLYTFYRTKLLNCIYAINVSLLNYSKNKLLNNPLYWSLYCNNDKNQNILKKTSKYFIRSERFIDPLWWLLICFVSRASYFIVLFFNFNVWYSRNRFELVKSINFGKLFL